jgi:hypothetical protein
LRAPEANNPPAKPARPQSVTLTKQGRQTLANYHAQHYAENPALHARALRALGLPKGAIQEIASEAARKTGFVKTSPNEMGFAPGNDFFTKAFRLGERTIGDFGAAAEHTPAGLYLTGKAAGQDVGQLAHGQAPTHLAHLGKQIGLQTAQDFEHPGRHPGNVLLDVFAAASAGAGTAVRLGAAGSALREGDLAGAIARPGFKGGSLLRKPEPAPITRTVGDLTVESPASRNPLLAALQRGTARFQEQHPNVPAGAIPRTLNKRVGFELEQNQRVATDVANAPGNRLIQLGRKLNKPQQSALRVVAEGQPVEKRIQFHLGQIEKGVGSAADHQRQISLLKRASKYVTTQAGKPVIADAKLAKVYDLMKQTGASREDILAATEQLSPEGIVARVNRPAQVIEGQHFTENELAQLGRGQQSLLHPESNAKGETYVPYYKTEPRVSPNAPRQGSGGVVGRVKNIIPKRGKQFTGSALEHGLVPDNTTGLVARQYKRAIRYLSSDQFRQQLLHASHDTRESAKDVLINDRSLKNPAQLAPEIKAAVGKENLTLDELSGHQHAFAAHLKRLFPMENPRDLTAPELSQEQRVAAAAGEKVPGYKWVHQDLLRGLNRPVGGSGKGWKVVDAVNRGVRLALLEMNPKYAATIGTSNAFMELLHNYFNPLSLARSATDWHHLAAEDKAAALAGMGEGYLESAEGGSRLQKFAGLEKALIRGEGKVINAPVRMSSFMREARMKGYRTPEQIHQLLTDPKLASVRTEVFRRGKSAVIDFGRLSDKERAYASRLLFFYPWVKGATMYAGHVVGEHPLFAGEVAQSGRVSQRQQLGKYGQPNIEGKNTLAQALEGGVLTGPATSPREWKMGAINPSQTPVDTAKVLLGKSFDPQSLLTPAFGLPVSLASGTNLTTGQKFGKNVSFGSRLAQSLQGFVPLLTAKQRAGGWGRLAQGAEALLGLHKPLPATNQEARHLFPYTPQDAMLKELAGGLASAPVNQAAAAKNVLREEIQGASPQQRAVLDVKQLRRSMLENFHKLGGKGNIPPEIEQALKNRAKITSAIASAGTAPLDKLKAALKAAGAPPAVQRDWLGTAQRTYKAWPQDKADKYTRKMIATIERNFYETLLTQAVKELNDAGGDVVYAPSILP